jgi:serine/threonine-protein kinase
MDAGTCERHGPYLVMELVNGRALSGILCARRKLDVVDSVLIGARLSEALHWAHWHGIIHRDVKPANILIGRSDLGHEVVKLCDFGVAHVRGTAVDAPEDRLTRPGDVMGTPEYMSPEQLLGSAEAKPSMDQYSIAATVYECLCGTTPFGGTYGQILLASQSTPPPRLSEQCADLTPALVDVVARALAKDPTDRYPDVLEFARSLVAAANPERHVTRVLGLGRGAPPPLPVSAGPSAQAMAPSDGAPRRRRHTRAAYVTPVRLLADSVGVLDGQSEDLSERGVLVICDSRLADVREMQLQFAMPISGRVVTVRAATRWRRLVRGSEALGFEFMNASDAMQTEIAKYVQKMSPNP